MPFLWIMEGFPALDSELRCPVLLPLIRKKHNHCVFLSASGKNCRQANAYGVGCDGFGLSRYGEEEKRKQALKNHHMLFSEAAEIARAAQPAALLLTHFSTSIEDPESYLPETRLVFKETYTARDGLCLTLRYPKEEEKAWISLC